MLGTACQQSGTAVQNVIVGNVEIAGIPRISHIAGAVGIVQYFTDLAFGISFEHAKEITDVGAVHTDDEIKIAVVCPCDLPGPVAAAVNAGFGEFFSGTVVDGSADLLGGGGGGVDEKFLFMAGFSYQMLHNIFRHGGTTDIAMADKQDFYHISKLLIKLGYTQLC